MNQCLFGRAARVQARQRNLPCETICGDGLRAASLMLRHSDQGLTQISYVNNTRQERRAIQAAKVAEISETRKRAAATRRRWVEAVAVN